MSDEDVTTLLVRWTGGDREALNRLMPLVYDELRQIAANHLRRERQGHSMESTSIVHEAFIKLIDQRRIEWQNRAHFYGVAAQMIRRILVDHARANNRQKRGGGAETIVLDEALLGTPSKSMDIVALDDALDELAKLDAEQSRVVELRFFGGLTLEETAEALSVSRTTVHRHWVTARAWLIRELRA